MYLFALYFRHEVLHGERAASTCQPFSSRPPRTFCRRSLLASRLTEYHSHPLAARMTLVCLCEDESFVQRLSVPFIFILNGLPLSVPGTLLPPAAVTRLQLFRIKNSPSYNQILVYILHPADLTEQARSLLLLSVREQKQVGDRQQKRTYTKRYRRHNRRPYRSNQFRHIRQR